MPAMVPATRKAASLIRVVGTDAESAARSLSRVAMMTRPARVPRTLRAASTDRSRKARQTAYIG